MVMGLAVSDKPDTAERPSTPTFTVPCLHRAGVTFNLLSDLSIAAVARKTCKTYT